MKVTLGFGIVDFFERQLHTKTGRLAMLSVVSVWSAYLLETTPEIGLLELVGAVVSAKEAVGVTLLSLLSMFLRDKEAKNEQAARRKSKRTHRGGSKKGGWQGK